MPGRVYVTGIGIITSIGTNTLETLASLANSHSGIQPVHYLHTIHKHLPVAEVRRSNEELEKYLGIHSPNNLTRSTLLGMVASREAIAMALQPTQITTIDGLISAITVGGMDKSELYYTEFIEGTGHAEYINTHDCAESTERIADFSGIRGHITTLSTACSSSANSIIYATRLIQNGLANRLVAGGTECLTRFHLNGFQALSVLDPEPCKPFDNNRNGINLGEGAAYLVLESEEFALQHAKRILCEIKGYSNVCEAYHQTASSAEGEGASMAMMKAIEMAGLSPSEISYINAHGTGTENNDLAESLAIQTVFGKTIPPFSSTKSFTGHTTSAAGAVEAILCILAMQNNLLLPNLNFRSPIEVTGLIPVTQLSKNARVDHILSNSFGFGGNDSSLIFSRV
jgi:3-oxoacyl-[acyl-carrier-protein] synthase-1